MESEAKLVKGVVPALITPFDKERKLAVENLPKIVTPLLEAGVAGLFVCGATGEPTTMTIEERKKMTDAVVGEVGGQVPVIIHVGATDLESARVLASHAKAVGATAIGSLPPLDKASDTESVIDYYREVGKAGDLPFYVYWRADMASKDLTPEKFLEHMEGVPNFVGIKFTDTNFYFLQRLITLSDGKLNCLTGPDEMFVAGLVMGADGAIGSTYNMMPKNFVNLYSDFHTGKVRESMQRQFHANELISLLRQYGVISGIKAILEKRGIPAGLTRPGNELSPFTEITGFQLGEMMAIVEKYDLR